MCLHDKHVILWLLKNKLICWLFSIKNYQQGWTAPLREGPGFCFLSSRDSILHNQFFLFWIDPIPMLYSQSHVKTSLTGSPLAIYPRVLVSTVFSIFLGTESIAANVLGKCPVTSQTLTWLFFSLEFFTLPQLRYSNYPKCCLLGRQPDASHIYTSSIHIHTY